MESKRKNSKINSQEQTRKKQERKPSSRSSKGIKGRSSNVVDVTGKKGEPEFFIFGL